MSNKDEFQLLLDPVKRGVAVDVYRLGSHCAILKYETQSN